MSRVARTALVATAVFVVAGVLSGLLIDEHDGVAGALEWALRTAVVISMAVALVAAFVLVLRQRRRVRSRVLGWAGTRAGRPAARRPSHQLPKRSATVPVLGQRG